ncbi:hypothetical protein [Methylocapsa acidiphila]|uniref:hypothetical protein n=1 Tax=Methylocapsa acidiphila TaxID=133552 RepID=UPI0004135EBB|nr:hypothetical protein [Methylocapsa acidiphila]
MSICTADRRKLFRIVLFVIGGVLTGFALGVSARAEESHILIIPPDDGYGLHNCLSEKSACGMVVADAWCEAHGLAASKSYGPAENMAQSIDANRAADIRPGSYLVACGE